MNADERALARALLAERLGYTSRASSSGILPNGSDWERREAKRAASVGSDVVVPVAQSVVSGAMGAALMSVVGGWEAGLLAGVVVAAGSWALLLSNHVQSLWRVERFSGGDGEAEAAQAPARVVRVELVDKGSGRLRWMDLPIDEAQLAEVGREVLVLGSPFSRDGLSSVLSQSQYRKLAAVLVDAGLLVEGGGNKREVTSALRALLRAVMEGD